MVFKYGGIWLYKTKYSGSLIGRLKIIKQIKVRDVQVGHHIGSHKTFETFVKYICKHDDIHAFKYGLSIIATWEE